jgi:hypothetical protein
MKCSRFRNMRKENSMPIKKLLYFTLDTGSAFNSQVLGLLEAIGRYGDIEEKALLIGSSNKIPPSAASSFKTITIPLKPIYWPLQYFDSHKLTIVLKELGFDDENAVIHCRGEVAAWMMQMAVKKFKSRPAIIADIRGAVCEEIRDFLQMHEIPKMFKLFTVRKALQALPKCAAVSCVSEQLKRYLIERVPLKSDHLHINFCCADNSFVYSPEYRNKIRTELGFTEQDRVIVFSAGSDFGWQNSDSIISQIPQCYKILLLTKKVVCDKRVVSRYVKFSEMPGYLSAADFGLMFRRQHIVNTVASPIKFSEYLCCGLPVIHNGTVPMVENEYWLPMTIRYDNQIPKDLPTTASNDRLQTSQKMRVMLSAKAMALNYMSLYTKIVDNNE